LFDATLTKTMTPTRNKKTQDTPANAMNHPLAHAPKATDSKTKQTGMHVFLCVCLGALA
jgi:hypothetical protein